MPESVLGTEFDIDCPECIIAVATSLRWAHGDPVRARDVMEAKFADAHAKDPFKAGASLEEQARAYLHLSRYFQCVLGSRGSIQ